MVTIKTNTVLKDFKGESIKNLGKEITVGTIISDVLGGKVSNPTLGWNLGKKFACDKEVDLKAEDVVFIKRELEQNGQAKEYGYTALIIGQVLEILEAKPE